MVGPYFKGTGVDTAAATISRPFETQQNIFLPKKYKIDYEYVFEFTDFHGSVKSFGPRTKSPLSTILSDLGCLISALELSGDQN